MTPRAWISGASRGIGAALAVGLAAKGWNVALTSTTEGSAEEVSGLIRSLGGSPLVLPADVADHTQVKAAAQAIADRWGGLELAVAAAGISGPMRGVLDLDVSEWDRVMQVNVGGTVSMLREAGRLMREKKITGSLIAVSSVHAVSAARGIGPYATSKGAIEAFVRVLAADTARFGIRANVLAPGYVETDINSDLRAREHHRARIIERTMLKRFGQPEELLSAVEFLASPDSSFVTGSVVRVDGGWTAG